MLECMADGTKLPPYVVFKRKTMPKDKFLSGVIVRMQKQGWFNDSLMDDWLKTVWINTKMVWKTAIGAGVRRFPMPYNQWC